MCVILLTFAFFGYFKKTYNIMDICKCEQQQHLAVALMMHHETLV